MPNCQQNSAYYSKKIVSIAQETGQYLQLFNNYSKLHFIYGQNYGKRAENATTC